MSNTTIERIPGPSRRRLLGGLAAGAAALATGCTTGGASSNGGAANAAATNGPSSSSSTATDFLLVHGAWHNSSCWAEVQPLLAARGHRALAIDMPGHGLTARFPTSYLQPGQPGLAQEMSPLADITLDDAAQAVIDALRGLREGSQSERQVVLVGHSLGGIVITRAAQLAPELVDHLVYLAAVAPTQLNTGLEYLSLPEQGPTAPGLYIGDPVMVGTTRLNPRSTDPAYLELARSVFYGDIATEEFLAYANGLTPDLPVRIPSDPVGATADRWGAVPRTYIRTAQDRALLPALQDRMIRDADELAPSNPFRSVTIDSSHSPFASRPDELAQVLTDITRS